LDAPGLVNLPLRIAVVVAEPLGDRVRRHAGDVRDGDRAAESRRGPEDPLGGDRLGGDGDDAPPDFSPSPSR
jgi:hypothetical protein